MAIETSKFHAMMEKLVKLTASGELIWGQNSKDDQSFKIEFPFNYKVDKLKTDGSNQTETVDDQDIVRIIIAHVREQQFKYVINVQRDQRSVRLEVATVGTSLDKLIVELYDAILTRRANLGLSQLEKNVPEGTDIDLTSKDDFDIMKLIDEGVKLQKANLEKAKREAEKSIKK